MGLPKSIKKISDGTHGNSLDYEGVNYDYKLVDKDTGEVLKYGESITPDTRYTKKYLESINAKMEIMTSGTKLDIHNWQHDMIREYFNKNGIRPPANLSDW